MMRWIMRMTLRELIGMRAHLFLFVAIIAIGVGSYVSLLSLTDAFRVHLHGTTRQFLGGDIEISGQRPLPAELEERLLHWPNVTSGTRIWSTLSMLSLSVADEPRLVEVRVIDPTYPLLDGLVTVPPAALRAFREGVLLDASLLSNRAPPKEITLAGQRLSLAGVISRSSSLEIVGFFSLPIVFVRQDLAKELKLLSTESRFSEKILLTFAAEADVVVAEKEITAELKKSNSTARVRTYQQAAQRLDRAIQNTGGFILVLGLACLMLAALATIAGVLEYLRRRLEDVAVLRCLGARPSHLLAIYALTIIVLLTAGISLGLFASIFLQMALQNLPMIKAISFHPAIPETLQRGVEIATVLVATVGVAVVPRLIFIVQSSAREALRDAAAVSMNQRSEIICAILALSFLPLLYLSQTGINRFSLSVTAVSAMLFLLFSLVGYIVIRMTRRYSHAFALPLRLAIHEVAARRFGSTLLLSVIGFATFLGLSVYAIRGDIIAPLQIMTDPSRPNLYFIDVQSDQRARLFSTLQGFGASAIVAAPVVRGRLITSAGKPAQNDDAGGADSEEGEQAERERSGHIHELNMTYRDTLEPGEEARVIRD